MKQIANVFTAALVLLLVSCNNKPKETTETTTVDTAKVVVAAPVFQPYKAMIIQHTVKDFDKWLVGFNAHDSVRKANGLASSGVGRGLDNDKLAVLWIEATDVAKAKAFSTSAELKETMKKLGVTGPPTVSFVEVLRDDTSAIPQAERIMVTHHVKDFDAWLKVYDAEGLATRAANGMVDRGLARGIDDPNTVSLLFAITDMTKLKARLASPEMKKVMTDAGVDGPPQITFFKWLN